MHSIICFCEIHLDMQCIFWIDGQVLYIHVSLIELTEYCLDFEKKTYI